MVPSAAIVIMRIICAEATLPGPFMMLDIAMRKPNRIVKHVIGLSCNGWRRQSTFGRLQSPWRTAGRNSYISVGQVPECKFQNMGRTAISLLDIEPCCFAWLRFSAI